MLTTFFLILTAVLLAMLLFAVITWSMSRDCDFFTFWFLVRPATEGLCEVLGIVLVAIFKGGE